MKWLFDLLAGLLTKQRMAEAGASAKTLEGAATISVELPTFGGHEPGPPLGLKESRDLAHCDPRLKRRYNALKIEFEAITGRQLFETSTWRSTQRQQELYQIGRRGVAGEKTVTKLDGVTKKSRHNVYPSEAVDVCVDSDPGPGKHAVWDRAAYEPLGALCLKHGLTWGGAWASIDDYPHLELPA